MHASLSPQLKPTYGRMRSSSSSPQSRAPMTSAKAVHVYFVQLCQPGPPTPPPTACPGTRQSRARPTPRPRTARRARLPPGPAPLGSARPLPGGGAAGGRRGPRGEGSRRPARLCGHHTHPPTHPPTRCCLPTCTSREQGQGQDQKPPAACTRSRKALLALLLLLHARLCTHPGQEASRLTSNLHCQDPRRHGRLRRARLARAGAGAALAQRHEAHGARGGRRGRRGQRVAGSDGGAQVVESGHCQAAARALREVEVPAWRGRDVGDAPEWQQLTVCVTQRSP